MGSDSPVIPELSTENSVESRIRQSAGTTSPTCKIRISPKDTRITQVMDGAVGRKIEKCVKSLITSWVVNWSQNVLDLDYWLKS